MCSLTKTLNGSSGPVVITSVSEAGVHGYDPWSSHTKDLQKKGANSCLAWRSALGVSVRTGQPDVRIM